MKLLKKFSSVFLCLCLMLPITAVAAEPNQTARTDVTSGVVYGDVTGDLAVKMDDVVALQKYMATLDKLTETQMKLADVNNDSYVKMDDIVEIQRFIADIITSFPADSNIQDYVSRIEWISELVSALELKNDEINVSNGDIAFKDVRDSDQREDLRYAVANGIIIPDSRVFDPNSPAKREFVATTLVNALGFYGDYPLDCADANEISDKTSVALALKTNYLSLKDSKFYPDTNITETEMKGILYKIDLLELSTKISNQYDGLIKYKDNVSHATNGTNYTLNDNTFTISKAELGSTTVGDIYVLPADETNIIGTPCKITAITYDGDNAVCTYTTPELKEIYNSIDSQGIAAADINNIEVDDNNIDYEVKEPSLHNPENSPRMYNFDDSDSFKLFDSLTFSLKDYKINDSTKISASISLIKPTISYAIDADLSLSDGVDIRNFYLALSKDLNFSATVSSITGPFQDGKLSLQLAKIPFALGPTGLTVDLVLSLKASLSGTLSLEYSFGDIAGIQIKNNVPRCIYSVRKSESEADVSASLSLGSEIKLQLAAFKKIEIIDFSASAGLNFELSNFETHDDVVCNDACIWLYANASVGSNSLIGSLFKLSLSWNILNKSNTPFKLNTHMENLKFVDECSFDGESNDFKYDVVNGEAVIWEYGDETAKTLVIPEKIDGYHVAGISEWAFYGLYDLESIEIPASVTDIQFRAFYDCSSLKTVTIPLGVLNVGESAFENCVNLSKVYISGSVSYIGINAFKNCDENIVLYGLNNSYAHKYAIRNSIAFLSV